MKSSTRKITCGSNRFEARGYERSPIGDIRGSSEGAVANNVRLFTSKTCSDWSAASAAPNVACEPRFLGCNSGCESGLTWSRREAILRQPGCSTPRWIPGVRLHPFESRKTRPTVICCILFLRDTSRKCSPASGPAATAPRAGQSSSHARNPRLSERAATKCASPFKRSGRNSWWFLADFSRPWRIVRLRFWPGRVAPDRVLGEGRKSC